MKTGLIVDACVFSEKLLDARIRHLIDGKKGKIITASGTKFHSELVRANPRYYKKSASKGLVEFIDQENVAKKRKQLAELKSSRAKRAQPKRRSAKRRQPESLIKSNDLDVLAIGITARANCLVTTDPKLSEDYPIAKEIEKCLDCPFSSPKWPRKPAAITIGSTSDDDIEKLLKNARYATTACLCNSAKGGC